MRCLIDNRPLLIAAAFAALTVTAAAHAQVEAEATTAQDTSGFLYGKVTTRDNVYQGRLRWDDEEAFWGDHFNGSKDDLPYRNDVPRDARRRRDPIRIFGITIGSTWHDRSGGRQTTVRFGDLRSIEPEHGDNAILTLKSGSRLEVDGGSNDIGADVVVWDASLGEVTVDWRRIERIDFLPTPAGLPVDVFRLQGTVETDAGTFEGYVQWDSEECLSSDVLDGDDRDGRVKLPMGTIRSIERRSRSSSRVVLKDGREMVLDGTNDVDHSNRGILVEDARYGRVEVSWDAFERVTFVDRPSSGPAYDDFAPSRPISGTVIDRDGNRLQGRLVYDIDETETWETLDGNNRDIEYSIPFALVRSIEPLGRHGSRVELIGGEVLELEDVTDVNEDNAGVLVLTDGGRPTYVFWLDIDRIELDHGGR